MFLFCASLVGKHTTVEGSNGCAAGKLLPSVNELLSLWARDICYDLCVRSCSDHTGQHYTHLLRIHAIYLLKMRRLVGERVGGVAGIVSKWCNPFSYPPKQPTGKKRKRKGQRERDSLALGPSLLHPIIPALRQGQHLRFHPLFRSLNLIRTWTGWWGGRC